MYAFIDIVIKYILQWFVAALILQIIATNKNNFECKKFEKLKMCEDLGKLLFKRIFRTFFVELILILFVGKDGSSPCKRAFTSFVETRCSLLPKTVR